MTIESRRTETTIPPGAAVIRALGDWLAPGGGHDEQDALVELIVRTHAHPDYHPDRPGDLADICKVVVLAADDEAKLWHVVNGAANRPCARRLAAHGRLLDTPPAVVGDKDRLCRGCREAETARVPGDDPPDPDADAADDPGDGETRAHRAHDAAIDVLHRLPTADLEALHDAAGDGRGPVDAGTIAGISVGGVDR